MHCFALICFALVDISIFAIFFALKIVLHPLNSSVLVDSPTLNSSVLMDGSALKCSVLIDSFAFMIGTLAIVFLETS